MGHRLRQRKNLTSSGIGPTTTGFDLPLLYRLSYEARREPVVGDYGGNRGHVNMVGTNECCAACTKIQK